MANSKFDWYGHDVRLLIRDAGQRSLGAIALRAEGFTTRNIVANDQVDTGAMLNSVYSISPVHNNRGKAVGAAAGRNPEAAFAPEPTIDDNRAAVHVPVHYAIYQETKHGSFLGRALEQVRGDVAESEITSVSRSMGLT